MKKQKDIFSTEEIMIFQAAVIAAGLRSDAKRNAIALLEDNDKGDIVDKYNSMSQKAQREFRVLHREMKKGEADIEDFAEFICGEQYKS